MTAEFIIVLLVDGPAPAASLRRLRFTSSDYSTTTNSQHLFFVNLVITLSTTPAMATTRRAAVCFQWWRPTIIEIESPVWRRRC